MFSELCRKNLFLLHVCFDFIDYGEVVRQAIYFANCQVRYSDMYILSLYLKIIETKSDKYNR